ncbi:MAG: hypothetical protein OEY23_01900 [Acidimicrobiia bacterium]|nr:hypothetical protein [Acidimicrobiia bacterium]
MDISKVEALTAAKASQADANRPDAVARVRSGGRMTARERIAALLDPGSEVEFGSIAAQSADGEWVAEAGGVDFVGTIDGRTVVASSTDYTDHGGGYGAGRLARLMSVAMDQRWPIVFFVDGGGSRARHPRVGMGHIETSGAVGPITLFDGMAELSGWVPTVAIVSGPAFAGHASLAGFSDVVITTGGSSIGMGGPPMVEAALGKRLSATELAGVEMHNETGGIDLLVGDELEAIAAARRYLSYLDTVAPARTPAGGGGAAGQPPGAARPGSVADPADLVPDDGAFDVRPVLDTLVDAGSLFELRPAFARSLITAFARIDGHPVGLIANQPTVDDGALDENAATKVARFVELCDSYELAVVAVVDTPGCVASFDGGEPETAVTRWHLRAITAHHHRSVPLCSVQLRRGRGLGHAVMAGMPNGRTIPALTLAWPGVEIGRADGFSVVHNHNSFDDVIAPAQTRERIARMLGYLGRRPTLTTKKRPVDTW